MFLDVDVGSTGCPSCQEICTFPSVCDPDIPRGPSLCQIYHPGSPSGVCLLVCFPRGCPSRPVPPAEAVTALQGLCAPVASSIS